MPVHSPMAALCSFLSPFHCLLILASPFLTSLASTANLLFTQLLPEEAPSLAETTPKANFQQAPDCMV